MSPSLDDIAWPVSTARLSLRRPTAADAEGTWPYRRLPEVAEWLTRLPADRAAYDEWFASPEALDKMLLVEHDGEVIGDLMLDIKDAWAQVEVRDEAAGTEVELGWVLSPSHQGHGYATEAVAALLRLCFEDLGVRRVIAGCFSVNEVSWRLMERVGMRRESHTLGDALHRDHGWMDGLQYALLAEEWRALGSS